MTTRTQKIFDIIQTYDCPKEKIKAGKKTDGQKRGYVSEDGRSPLTTFPNLRTMFEAQDSGRRGHYLSLSVIFARNKIGTELKV